MAIKTSSGVSSETAGAQGLALSAVTISAQEPEGAHLHEHHETALYLLEGTLVVYHGDWLQEHTVVRPGEFLYLPAGEVHAFSCIDPARPCRALVARTDPQAHEPAQLLPELAPLLGAA